MTTRRIPYSPTAVVLGGGLTGMLAAAVLAAHAEVHIVERDVLPASPAPRKGLPQAQHAHLLWSGGARTIESLLPGVTQRWLSAGARRIPLPTGLVSLTAQGWLRRWPEMQYLIACSRDLLDWGVRQQVLDHPGIRVHTRTEPVGLSGTAGHVTGVEVRDTATGDVQRLDADLVIDATGRGSAATTWLAALGLPPVTEEHVDSGLAYATRIFRAPAGTEHWPIVNVQSDASAPVPGQTATLVPLEEARWLVTLSGTRGGQPTREADEFLPFARNVRHPIVAELIAGAEPLTDVHLSRSTVNRRRRFDLLRAWPRGFAVLGDAVATYNPSTARACRSPPRKPPPCAMRWTGTVSTIRSWPGSCSALWGASPRLLGLWPPARTSSTPVPWAHGLPRPPGSCAATPTGCSGPPPATRSSPGPCST